MLSGNSGREREWLEVDATKTEEDADEAALSLSSSPEQRVTVMVASEGQACMPWHHQWRKR